MLLARLGPWLWFARVEPFTYDEREYDTIAVTIAQSGEFAREPGKPTTIRPPLYPVLVTGVYRLFGNQNYQAVRLLQAFMGVGIAGIVYLIGLSLYDARTGWWAAALIGFYPSLWGHENLILTEVPFTFLLCLGCLALQRFFVEERWPLLIAGAGVLGLATLTRSVLQVYPPLFILLVLALSKMSPRRRFAVAAAFLVSFSVVVSPWIVRNSRLNGRLSPVDSAATRVVKRYSAPVFHRIAGPGFSGVGARQEPGRATQKIRRAIRHGLRFWRIDRSLSAAAVQGLIGPIPRAVALGLAVCFGGYYVLLILLGVAGGILRPPPDRVQLALILSFFVLLMGVHALTIGHSRYHIPLMPFVAVFAARLVVVPSRSEKRGRLVWVAIVSLVLVVSWANTFVAVDLPELLESLENRG